MAESYSVKAILSAADKGFTSTMKAASNYVGNLKSTLTSGLGFGIAAAAGAKAFDAIGGGVTGLIGDMNEAGAAWKTFQGNMEMNGKTEKQIKSIKSELQDFAEATIYSSSDMATTFAQLEAVGTKNTTKLVKGFGGLAAAAENPTQAMKTLSQQATQMAAKPKVAWEDFKLMLEQTPAGIAAVAKEMGMSTQSMIKNVQDGKIKTDEFFDAIAKVGTNKAFTKLATEYKTVGQAMDGLQETMANKLQPAFDVLSGVGIRAISKIVDKAGELDGEKIAKKLTSGLDKIKPYWDVIASTATEVGSAFGSAVSAISGELAKLNGEFGSTESVEGFGDAIGVAGGALKTFAGFLEEHADVIALLIDNLPKLLAGYMAFKTVKAIAPGVTTFGKAIVGLAGNKISGLAQKLFGVSKATKTVGNASATSGKLLMQSAVSFMAFGAGIALAAGGLYIMAQAAIQLANSGPGAVAVMVGMVGALAGLAKGASMIGPQLSAAAVGMVAFGAAVLLAGTGVYMLSAAAINLTSAGTPAIATLAGLAVGMAALMVVAAVLGPALTAGAIGLVAFGVAIALVGAGALMASASLAVVAAVLPTVSSYGEQGATAIVALGASMFVFAAGAAIAGAGAIALGAGLLIVGAGLVVVAASSLAASVGIVALATGTLSLSAGMAAVAASSVLAGASLLVVSAAALAGTAAFAVLTVSAAASGAAMVVVVAALVATGTAAAGSAVAVAAFALAMTAGAAGTAVMAVSLKLVNGTMKSIAKNAKSAQQSISSMRTSINVVNDGLDALGNAAKSAVKSFLNAFSSAKSKARTTGKEIGDAINNGIKTGTDKLPNTIKNAMNRFNSGLNSGKSRAVSTARSMGTQIVSAMRSAQSGAYSSGRYIGQGLANGMSSTLGAVRSVAAQLAAAADAAIRAKAKIHSPSRVSEGDGEDWGQGWVNGILSKVRDARVAAMELISIPNISIPTLDLAYSTSGGTMSLNSEYDYNRKVYVYIEVPVDIDGREVAKASAEYVEDELNKRQTRYDRKHGRR